MHNERNNAQMHTPKYAPMLLYEIKYIKKSLNISKVADQLSSSRILN